MDKAIPKVNPSRRRTVASLHGLKTALWSPASEDPAIITAKNIATATAAAAEDLDSIFLILDRIRSFLLLSATDCMDGSKKKRAEAWTLFRALEFLNRDRSSNEMPNGRFVLSVFGSGSRLVGTTL